MKQTKVVNLGQIRDLLAEWHKVRAHILGGRIDGFQAMFRDSEQQECIFVGGIYREDPSQALRAALKMSAHRTLTEDPAPARMKRTK